MNFSKILIIVSLFFNISWAGIGQGNMSVINPQTIADFSGRIKSDPSIKIIYSTPPLNGVLRLSVGRIEKKRWQIEELDVPSYLILDSDLSQDIQKAINLNDWVEIKK